MIFGWFKKAFKKKPMYDFWPHSHWPSADDGFVEIIQVDHTATNEMIRDATEKFTERSKLEHPELWNEDLKRSCNIPHPHKGKRKGRRKVGSHIRRARHKRKHAKR